MKKNIINSVVANHSCFSGGCKCACNPIVAGLQDARPVFAAGVSVESVVTTVSIGVLSALLNKIKNNIDPLDAIDELIEELR